MLVRTLGAWLVSASLCLVSPPGSASASVEALLQQAEAVRSSNPKVFQQLLLQLNAEKQNATQKQREQLSYLNAYAEAYAGRYDVAIRDARSLIETSSDVDTRFRAGALIVNSYAVTRQFAEGLRQLEQTLSLVDRIRDPTLRQHGLIVAAAIYNQIGQYRLGLYYSEQILSESAPERTRCFAGQHKLEALQNLNRLPADDAPIIQVIGQCAGNHETVVANSVRGTLARKWAAHGQRDKAISLLQKHLAEVEATRYPRLISETQSLLAELLLAKGDILGAERHAQAAIAQSAGISYSLPLVTAYKALYDIDVLRRDTDSALEHFRHYAEVDKAYLDDVKARELAYQLVRQETLQKTQQIELLNRKNEVLQLQQRVDKQATQNTQLLAVLLAVLLASIGYWAFKTKRMQMSFRRLAETDSLTGISNRRHFTRQAEELLAYCAKMGEDVGLIMFDLDNFKLVNDRYGHVAGDCVLRRVADACKSQCRKNDLFGRLGGEEFAVLLAGCDLDAATQTARACCTRVAEIDTTECGHRFPVTASFGVTSASLSGYELTRLLSHADQMLYRSKHDGRNRVSVFSADALDVVFVTNTVMQHSQAEA